MDEIDKAILQLVQRDNRLSSNEIGRRVGLSVSAVNERVRRLNASGTVTANRAIVDPDALDLKLCAFLFVDIDMRSDEQGFIDGVQACPEVLESHHVAGSHSYLLKVRLRDTSDLQRFLSTKLKRLPGVSRTESVIVLETHKETTVLAADGED